MVIRTLKADLQSRHTPFLDFAVAQPDLVIHRCHPMKGHPIASTPTRLSPWNVAANVVRVGMGYTVISGA
jgi:hypothetical protein